MTTLTMSQAQLDAIRWHADETAKAYSHLDLPPSQASQDRTALLTELDRAALTHQVMSEGVRAALRAGRDHSLHAAMSVITNYADAAGLLDALDAPRPATYVNGDSGYPWLTCGGCEKSLLQVQAGTSLAEMNAAEWAHKCAAPAKTAGKR
ncbi:hypothetical protein [Streptosporangium canum]|uniref:hypothetical protein n=1 Tax=Streptosporangium canum TaxID=324952 RepID=UPI0037B393B2